MVDPDSFSALFGDDQPLLDDLAAESTRRSHRKGELVAGEGDSNRSVFYILEGEAIALRYSVNGTEVHIDTFASGDLVGELAVLTDGTRTADIYASSDLQVALFPATVFVSLMERHGIMGLSVSRLLARRLQATTRRMFEQTTLSSKGRVYAELMRLSARTGSSEALQIKQLPSISQIAKKIGIARETVSRAVSELKSEGVIAQQGADLLIHQPQALISRMT